MKKELSRANVYTVLKENFVEKYKELEKKNNYSSLNYNVYRNESNNFLTFAFNSKNSGAHYKNPVTIIYDKDNYILIINFKTVIGVQSMIFNDYTISDFHSIILADPEELFSKLYYRAEFNKGSGLLLRMIDEKTIKERLIIARNHGYIDEDTYIEIMKKLDGTCISKEDYEEVLGEYLEIENFDNFLYEINPNIINVSCIFKEIRSEFFNK